MSPVPTPADERRYYGLDALRGAMMMLGIVVHAASLYLAAPPPHVPMIGDPSRSIVMDWIVDFIHGFRMPTFFALAGFFAALLVEKHGVAGALRNRAARVAAPLLAAMFTLLPLTLAAMLYFVLSARYGVRELLPDAGLVSRLEREMKAMGAPTGIPLLHLWFLLYLCYFYLLIPACRVLLRWSRRAEASVRRFLVSPLSLPVLGLYTAATLWPYPGAQVYGDFIMLGFSPPAALYYGSFFVVGYAMHHYRDVARHLAGRIAWCAGLAAVLLPLSRYASHLEYAHGGAAWHLFAVVAHGLCTWTLVWLFVGLALRFFDRPTSWALYVSQSAYWVFLLHLPVVCAVAWLVMPLEVHALVKFAIVVAATSIACFVTYHYWVRDTWLGAFLHGKRFDLDWPWRAKAQPS